MKTSIKGVTGDRSRVVEIYMELISFSSGESVDLFSAENKPSTP